MTVPWNNRRLSELVTKIGSGLTPKGGSSVYASSGVPFIRSQNVVDDFLYLRDVACISPSLHQEMAGTHVRPRDVLLNITGASIGRSCVVPDEFVEGNVNQHVCIIRPGEDLDPYFLQAFFSSDIGQKQIDLCQAGGNRQGLNYDQIGRFPIPFPSLDEQIAISAVIGVWHHGVKQISNVIAAKLHFKQGLLQQLLTGKRRFEGFVDDWKTVHLRDVAEECQERNRGRLGTESVMAVTKAEGIIPMRERTIAADIDRYSVVKKNYFAYNPMRLNIGSIARWTGEQDILVSPDYVVFHCKQPNDHGPAIDTDFLDQYRRFCSWERYVNSSGNGSVRVRIYFSDLGGMKLRLPSLPEQRKIAAVLNAADHEMDLLRKELDALKKQKKGLMQKLLTGQVRVKP